MLFLFLFPLLGAFLGWLFFFSLNKIFWLSKAKMSFAELFKKLSEEVGNAMESKLLGTNGILSKELKSWLEKEATIASLKPSVTATVHHFVDEKLEQRWPMIQMFLNAEAKEKMKAGLIEEILKSAPSALQNAGDSLIHQLEKDRLIARKFSEMPLTESKKVVFPYLQPIFQKLIWIGIVNGFAIGLLLGLLVLIIC